MCIYIYVNLCIYIYIRAIGSIYIYTYICIYLCIHMCKYIYIYTHLMYIWYYIDLYRHIHICYDIIIWTSSQIIPRQISPRYGHKTSQVCLWLEAYHSSLGKLSIGNKTLDGAAKSCTPSIGWLEPKQNPMGCLASTGDEGISQPCALYPLGIEHSENHPCICRWFADENWCFFFHSNVSNYHWRPKLFLISAEKKTWVLQLLVVLMPWWAQCP